MGLYVAGVSYGTVDPYGSFTDMLLAPSPASLSPTSSDRGYSHPNSNDFSFPLYRPIHHDKEGYTIATPNFGGFMYVAVG